jgi:hypothetical protein
MLARAWFVVSLSWAAFMLWLFSEDGGIVSCLSDVRYARDNWLMLVSPFILGLLVRWAFRYVVWGPHRFRRY